MHHIHFRIGAPIDSHFPVVQLMYQSHEAICQSKLLVDIMYKTPPGFQTDPSIYDTVNPHHNDIHPPAAQPIVGLASQKHRHYNMNTVWKTPPEYDKRNMYIRVYKYINSFIIEMASRRKAVSSMYIYKMPLLISTPWASSHTSPVGKERLCIN